MELMESSTFSIKKEFEELLEDKPDVVDTGEIKTLKDDFSNNFMGNSFCSADVKSEFKKDNEDNCIFPGDEFHTNETISKKEKNITIANMKSSIYSIKEEFEELPEDKPDLLEIQEIKILKDNEDNCISLGNPFHTNESISEKEENITIVNIMKSSTFSVKEEFEELLEDKPNLVDTRKIKVSKEDDSSNNFMTNVKSEFKKDNEDNCISPANQFHTNETISEKEENIWSIKDNETREIINKCDEKCRLCLRSANATVLFNEMDREILEILLINIDIKESAPSFICNDCSNMLQETFAFKSSCQDTEDSLTPFIDSQNLGTLDISTVFHEIHKDQKTLLPKNANICRFCLQILEKVSFTFLKDLSEADLEMLKTVVPDMQLEATKEPLICEKCLYCFKISFKFINDCLSALKQCHNISSISLNDNLDSISFSQNEIKIEENNLVLSKADSENSRNPDDATLDLTGTKTKCDKKPIVARPLDFHNDLEAQVYKCDKCSFQTKYKYYMKKHNLRHDEAQMNVHKIRHKNPEETEMYKCDKCSFQTRNRSSMWTHKLMHGSKVYKCDHCTFQTKYKMNIKRHNLTHDEVDVYKCDICQFQTIHKDNLILHQLTHKKSEEVQMYKCDKCLFQTKYKAGLRKHIRRLHEGEPSPVKTQVYKCDNCTFQTKYKTNIKRHCVMHNEFKCDVCPFQTVHKKYMNEHKLTHKKPMEVEMFKCDKCSFESKNRSSLWTHKLMHESQVYKCDNCSFQTKYKTNMKRHCVMHNEFKCDVCPFQTVHKKYMNEHKLTHKPVEVEKFKCDKCSFETKNRSSLWTHKLMHESQVYKCDNCSFETKYKTNMKRHNLIHDESQLYKCDKCSFQTKYRHGLRKHRIVHHGKPALTEGQV